jgi:pyruvate dehydrogenase (quinone)
MRHLLMIGTSYPYIEYLPKPADCRPIQIDSNAQRVGLRTPVEVGLVGDSKKTIQLLLPLLKRNSYRHFLEKAQKNMTSWSQIPSGARGRYASPLTRLAYGYLESL